MREISSLSAIPDGDQKAIARQKAVMKGCLMRLQEGLDLLHRRVEEWTEEALQEAEGSNPDIEGFGEYGVDLIAFLQDVVEELEVGDETLKLASNQVASRELCEELWTVLSTYWETVEFADRPAGLHIDELRPVLLCLATVLDEPLDEVDDALEEAVEILEEFMAEV